MECLSGPSFYQLYLHPFAKAEQEKQKGFSQNVLLKTPWCQEML